jgi:hypothetical protein
VCIYHVHICARAHTHIYIHTYIHTHTHTCQHYTDIGRADLMPGGLPSPVNPYVSGPFGPEPGGSLLGPRHPGFGPGPGIGPQGFGGPGSGIPGARFDPYGPPGVFPGFPGVRHVCVCMCVNACVYVYVCLCA